MKAMFVVSLFISYSAFAQTMQVSDLKKIFTENQKSLEAAHVGMTKKNSTISKITTEVGVCDLEQTATQTIISIEGNKIIVFSSETQLPSDTPACVGFEKSNLNVLFYDSAPSLADDLSALDTMELDLKKISKQANVVTIETTNATLKYDVTKSSFKNLMFYQDKDFSSTTSEMADIDVNTFNLTNILFCESATSDACIEGDFSDILF